MKFTEQKKTEIKNRTRKYTALTIATGVVVTSFVAAYVGAKEGAAAGLKAGSIDIRVFSTDEEGTEKLIPKKN